MATKARQQYFADEVSLSKEKREFSIADEIQQKIDSIEEGAQVNKIETVKVNGTALIPDAYKAVNIDVPEVIDNLYTVDSDNALSAKQGKLLYDYIQNIASRGRFLSNWNSATGLPMTNPSESPYPYKSGDYFIVSNVAGLGGTNYRPDGSSYIIGQASTVVETDSVDVSDFYFYDGTNWLLLKNSGRSGAVDSSLSTTSTNPVENRVITNALNGKQETLIAGNNIQIAADGKTISATDTTYSAGANISIDANNEISATDTKYTAGTNVQISNQNVISATDTTYTAGTGINIDSNNVISNTQTSAEWGNITGTLSDQTDLQTVLNAKQDNMVILKYGTSTWNDFITAYNKNGVIYCRASSNSNPASGSQTRLAFMAYVNNETTPTEVEFQYYRSRSDHNTAANQLDQVFVYKLTSASGGTWTVTERNTAAKAVAGTGINLAFGSGNMTISADTTTLATKTDLNSKQDALVSGTNIKTVNNNSLLGSGNLTLNDVKVSSTAPASPTEGMVWYDTMNDVLKTYNGASWDEAGGGGDVRVFAVPAVNDDISDMITRLSAGKGVILHEMVSGTDAFYKVDYHDDVTQEITASLLYSYNGGYARYYTIVYNYSTKKVSTKTSSLTYFFSPETAGTQGQVLTKTNSGYEWAAPQGTTYNAGEGIAISTVHSDMQGPCGDGFHIPYHTELQALFSAWTSLGFTDTQSQQFLTYLHIPVGRRDFTGVSEPGDQACLWGADGIEANGEYWVMSIFDSTEYPEDNYIEVTTIWGVSQCFGYPIRAFKDTPIVPDNSWTVEYQGTGNAGIFHNSTLGLISVSSDGTNWITFKDKNEGATTVYNYGDTITDTNLGNVYQRGNNYGFPFTGNITTSSGTVDASNYGPGNYYSSSTFITRTYQTYNQPRDNSGNRNLWGGVSQGTRIGGDGNTIVNTGVLSVNGQTGHITVEEPIEYTAGEGIAIGTVHSDMQGPAPDGFHIPMQSEWEALCEILTSTFSMASNLTTMGTYLKMPAAGFRYWNDAAVYRVGEYGEYWSSTPYSLISFSLRFDSSNLDTDKDDTRAFGLSLRCFKDKPVIPTSSWTTLYDGSSVATGAGVFYNATDGLISASGDGTTWYTIMDKNLGATTVYNQGDTLTDANCGNFYQWGNNYGFPHSGTVTATRTQVDASNYGPGNYYNSSTFITTTSNMHDWSSVRNNNLWGGVTKGTWISDEGNSIINTGVLSVNGQSGAVTINEFTPGGIATTGYVVTKTAGGYEWQAPTGGIQLAPNSEYNIKYHWYGDEDTYKNNISQYYTDEEGDTAYFTTEEE